MNHPPSKPPDPAAVARPAGSPWRAIALGLLTDIGGTLLASMVLVIVFAGSPEEIEAASQAPFLGSWLATIGTLAGLAFSVAGGYVCARIVRRSELKFGAMQGVLANVLGMLLSGSSQPDDRPFLMASISFVAVLAGAVLGQIRNGARSQA